MDAITALLTRHSAAKLTEPAPAGSDLATIIEAGHNPPDHGRLKPWRFRILQGDERFILGDLMAESLHRREPAAGLGQLTAERGKALRAPMIILVSAKITPIAKVPPSEQIIAAGCAAHALLLAAHALGYGGQWKTGPVCRDPLVKQGLGLEPADEIIGFIYLGSVAAT